MSPPPLPIADYMPAAGKTGQRSYTLRVAVGRGEGKEERGGTCDGTDRRHGLWVHSNSSNTHRDEEEHAGDHGRERGPSAESGVDVPADADDECAEGGDDVAPVGDEVVCDVVARVRGA